MGWRCACLLAGLGAACGAPDGGAPDASGSPPVVLGASFHGSLGSRLAEVRARLEVPGARELVDEARFVQDGAPLQWHAPALAPGTAVRATVTAYDDTGRLAIAAATTTEVAPSRTLLLHATLNDWCALDLDDPDAWCAPWSCAGAPCDASFLAPGLLPDYAPDWWQAASTSGCGDAAGAPTLRIGRAEPPFAPLQPGETLQAEWGIQGGSHVFVSVAARGLLAEKSVVALAARFEQSPEDGALQKMIAPFAFDDAGCVLYGVRYVLPVAFVHDAPARIGATVADASGRVAHAHADVWIAPPP